MNSAIKGAFCSNVWLPVNAAVFPVDVIIIIIIIIVNCNWVVTRWQWLFYMYTKYEIGS